MEKEKPKISMKDILAGYIKHKNGAIFQVLENERVPGQVFLRAKNTYTKKPLLELRQGLVNGTWFPINEHEWKRWVKKDNEYIEQLTHKKVKRIILAQLLLELDEELVKDNADDKRFRAVLERSNKETERIASKMYDKLYEANKETLQNLANFIDELTTKMGKFKVEEFPYILNMVDKYLEDPEKCQKENLYFTKVD